MDEQLGRLVRGVRAAGARGRVAIVVVGDHGEGLGDHGEAQHGNLLYQSTMHVPLVLVGPGVAPGVSDTPVSTRRVFHTILDWAGARSDAHSLRGAEPEIVLGEAMKPFLEYGWQPQVMAVEGRHKAIHAGRIEIYDVVADPGGGPRPRRGREPARGRCARRCDDYPVPSLGGRARARGQPRRGGAAQAREPRLRQRRRRARRAQGRAAAGRHDARSSTSREGVRPLRPRGVRAGIPLLERILRRGSRTTSTPRCGWRPRTPRSGTSSRRVEAFERAAEIAPDSPDVRTYLALHYARGKEWERAVPLLERVVAETPDRLPALEALARGPRAAGTHRRGDRPAAEGLRACARPRRRSSSGSASWR